MEHPLGRKVLSHEIPPWVDADAAEFFITICCRHRGGNQLCVPAVGNALLDSARFYLRERRWFPLVFLLMPDHLHMIVSFGREYEMSKVIAGWRRYAATQQAIVWQPGFFEHRLRGNESWEEKAFYILNNPVRAGLVEDAARWPYVFLLDQHSGGERRRAGN